MYIKKTQSNTHEFNTIFCNTNLQAKKTMKKMLKTYKKGKKLWRGRTPPSPSTLMYIYTITEPYFHITKGLRRGWEKSYLCTRYRKFPYPSKSILRWLNRFIWDVNRFNVCMHRFFSESIQSFLESIHMFFFNELAFLSSSSSFHTCRSLCALYLYWSPAKTSSKHPKSVKL